MPPSTVHCRRYRNPPQHALMALYACPRICSSTGQQVVVLPSTVHCRIYACPAVCTNGALCLYPRPVALQTAGCLTAIGGSLSKIRLPPLPALLVLHACLRICGAAHSMLQYCHWRFTAEDTADPASALMALYACPRSCNSTGQQVVVLPSTVYCRGYG